MSRKKDRNENSGNDKNSPDLTDNEKNRNTTYTPNLEKSRRKANK